MTSILCQLCQIPGEPTEYKGQSAIRCPACDRILYRGLDT